jgi:hypothetical protein
MTRWRRNRRATARPAEPAGRRANGRGRSTTPRVVVEKVIDGRTPKARHPCRTVVRCTDRIGVVLPGPLPLRRAAARAPGALARRRTRLPGLVALGLLHRRHRRTPRRAPGLAHRAGASSFLASAACLAGMLASAAFGVHPFVLPAIGDARHALTVDNAAAPGAGLRIGLAWWVPGMLLAVAYCAYACRRFRGKVTLEGEGYWAWAPSPAGRGAVTRSGPRGPGAGGK